MEISRSDIPYDRIVHHPTDERFIKLPITNYLDILDIDPVPPQIALINALNSPKYRFVVAALSRRTGKSTISNIIGNLVTLVPGSHVLIMAPNYSLSQISWDMQRDLLRRFDIELERSNAKDKIIELKNSSTIRMGSISQANSVVGRSYDLIIFDEAALDDKGAEVFNIQLRPTLDKVNSKAVFISTPRGRNWFYDFWMRGFQKDEEVSDDENFEDWASIRSDYSDNPRAIEKDIKSAKAQMSKAEFEQEYKCSFNILEGTIFDFNAEDCVSNIDMNQIVVQDVIAGLDIGFRDDTAFLVIVTDGERFYVVDEYVHKGKTTSGHANKIADMIEKWQVDFTYIDSAAQQTKFDFAMNYSISCINAKKSVLDGIGYVASIIDHDRLIVDSSCRRTIEALNNYRWDTREGLINERPVHDDHSHPMDALRYAMYTHAVNVEVV
jgi:hypothetical protein